jgi:hypothetical protein
LYKDNKIQKDDEYDRKKQLNHILKQSLRAKKSFQTFGTKAQFHHCTTRSFYIRKLRTQLLCAYILGLHFTGARLMAQKLCVEHWWNWPQVSILPTFAPTFLRQKRTHINCKYKKLQAKLLYEKAAR